MKTRNYLFSIWMGICLFSLISCGGKTNDPEEPGQDDPKPEVVDHNWKVDKSSMNLSSSMNLIAAVDISGVDMQANDQLAAFVGTTCVGTCNPVSTNYGLRFYLTIYAPASTTGQVVSLRYYTANGNKVYKWEDLLTFQADLVNGLASSPYILEK